MNTEDLIRLLQRHGKAVPGSACPTPCPLGGEDGLYDAGANDFTSSEWAKIRWLHYIYMKEEGKLNRVRCECS